MNAYDEDTTPSHEFGGHPDMSFDAAAAPASEEPVQEAVVVDGKVAYGSPSYDDEGALHVAVEDDAEVDEA